jgi:hypothetical protein
MRFGPISSRLQWNQIEAAVATKFEHPSRVGQIFQCEDMFDTTQTVTGGGRSNAGRPKLAIRLMASLLYHKNSSISPDLLRLLQAALSHMRASQMRHGPAKGIGTGR